MLTAEMETRLGTESLVTTGFVVKRGYLPATPNKVIALYETGGSGPERFLGGSSSLEQPGLMVVVRGDPNDYDTPRLQIERLFQALQNWGGFTVSNIRYLGLTPLQSPFPRDRDANERVTFAVNFLVLKEMSATS